MILSALKWSEIPEVVIHLCCVPTNKAEGLKILTLGDLHFSLV